MPMTRSLLEVAHSPVDVSSLDNVTIAVNLTPYIGTNTTSTPMIASCVGGPIDSMDLWTAVTNATIPALVSGTFSFTFSGGTAGYGYRVMMEWTMNGQQYARFVIVRCTA